MSSATVAIPSIPSTANRVGVAAVIGVHLLSFVVLPLALLPRSAGWGLLLVLFAVLTVPHWALVHEAVHGHLDPEPGRNHRLGRLLSVLFGAPFLALRFGHLAHHALNSRTAERAEVYDPGTTPRWQAIPVYYFRLLVGLYLLEVTSSLLCFLPRRILRPIARKVFFEGSPEARTMPDRAERMLLSDESLREMRVDALACLAWLGLGFACFGAGGAWMLAAALLARALVISFMDNAPHYGGELDEPGQGFDMRVPRPLFFLVLNTNLHGTHHRHPNLPWTALPTAFSADGGSYQGSYVLVPLRQLKGPLSLTETRRAGGEGGAVAVDA